MAKARIDTPSRPPLRVRILSPLLSQEPDWPRMTAGELAAYSGAENRKRNSRAIRLISGFPARKVSINWERIRVADREIALRVYRPELLVNQGTTKRAVPAVLHVHGGGFVGTATQSDWINSHLARRLSAVVISVDHRLLDYQVSLADAVEDGWDTLEHVVRYRHLWGIDPTRIAVFGESAGAMIAAFAAIRASRAGMELRAQVLVNPCVDLTEAALDYPSIAEHGTGPMLTKSQIEFFRRLAVPVGIDPRALSPLFADGLDGLAPALVVVPTLDPIADHGRAYVEALNQAGTVAHLTEQPGAVHAFLSVPRLVPQARRARDLIAAFLDRRLNP